MNLVDLATAAHALGVTPAAIRQHIHRKHLTRYGTPRRTLIDLQELKTYVDNRRVAPKQPTPVSR